MAELIKRLESIAEAELVCDEIGVGKITRQLFASIQSACAEAAEQLAAADAGPLGWISVDQCLPAIPEDSIMSREVFVTDGEYIRPANLWLEAGGQTYWPYTGMGPITHWCEMSFLLPSRDAHREDGGDAAD